MGKSKGLTPGTSYKGPRKLGSISYDPERMANVIIEEKGFITRAARVLGLSAATIYGACKKFPQVQEALDLAREAHKDNTEAKLHERIDEGSDRLIQFYLSTVGRDRGYGQEIKVKNENSGTVTIQYVNDWRGGPTIEEIPDSPDGDDAEYEEIDE
jgi:hypothetical protein